MKAGRLDEGVAWQIKKDGRIASYVRGILRNCSRFGDGLCGFDIE